MRHLGGWENLFGQGATLAFISYFIHGFLNNFLDTDKLAIPVWSLAALIAAIDVFYADKEEFMVE